LVNYYEITNDRVRSREISPVKITLLLKLKEVEVQIQHQDKDFGKLKNFKTKKEKNNV